MRTRPNGSFWVTDELGFSACCQGGSQFNESHCFNSLFSFVHFFHQEILEQVVITNLDTGEKIPLSLAEEKIPQATNPLALHIMRITSEFSEYVFRTY